MSTSLIEECHRRAREARRSAETASMPSRKASFLEMEQRWLLAARSVAPKSIAQRKEPMTQQTIQPEDSSVQRKANQVYAGTNPADQELGCAGKKQRRDRRTYRRDCRLLTSHLLKIRDQFAAPSY